MNHPPDQRKHSDEEIRGFVFMAESKFDLPPGTLSSKCRKTINGIPVPEVKRAAIYYLSTISTTAKKQLTRFFGLDNHATVLHHIEQAKNFINNNDETFLHYYSIVQTIAI